MYARDSMSSRGEGAGTDVSISSVERDDRGAAIAAATGPAVPSRRQGATSDGGADRHPAPVGSAEREAAICGATAGDAATAAATTASAAAWKRVERVPWVVVRFGHVL